jgi:hypothetical protein
MPDFYSVVILEEWIEPVKPYLEYLTSSRTSENRGLASQCLEELNHITHTMKVMNTKWGQASFSTKQMHLMELVTTFLEMDIARRRFSI